MEPAAQSNEFDAFKRLAKKLVGVPKKEVDRRAAAWKKRRTKKTRRTA